MSEFVRFIDEREFEDGLSLRLQIGTVAVGDVCKIRFEDFDYRLKERPLRYAEATISIIAKQHDNGLIRLDYVYDAFRASDTTPDKDFFNEQSIALNHNDGKTLRTYLSDQPDPRWDGSMHELVDLESTISTF